MKAVKQQLHDENMGSSTHMPIGYDCLDEQKLAEYNILVTKRITLLISKLIDRTNLANEDIINSIKQLKEEKKQREDSVDQSEEEKNESELMITSITEKIEQLEKECTLDKIGQRMFGEMIDLRELQQSLKCEDGKFSMPSPTRRVPNPEVETALSLQIAMQNNYAHVNNMAQEKGKHIKAAEEHLQMYGNALTLVSFYGNLGSFIASKLKTMTAHLEGINIVLNEEVHANGMIIKPNSALHGMDFGAISYNLREKYLKRNPLTFVMMVEKAMQGPSEKNPTDLIFSRHVSELMESLEKMDLLAMYHQNMLPITLLVWITRADVKLQQKFYKILETADMKAIIGGDEHPLRGDLYKQMRKTMKEEFDRRSRESINYGPASATAISKQGKTVKNSAASDSTTTVSSLSNGTGVGAQATKSIPSERMEAKFQAARDSYPDSVEVKRSAGQTTTDNHGFEHPYTATKIVCKGCYKSEESYCKDARHSRIKCWNLVCYLCGLFGHSKHNCEVPADVREKAGLTNKDTEIPQVQGRKAKIDPETPEPRRTERVRKPKSKESMVANLQAMMAEVENKRRAQGRDLLGVNFTYYADWANVQEDSYFFSHEHSSIIRFTTTKEEKMVEAHVAVLRAEGSPDGESYKAITKGVPRSWKEALRSPVWGEAARKEWDVLIQTGSIVEISRDMADSLKNDGAQELFLFPIYEEKIREGITVYKVRLVADGAKQTAVHGVFSATPSKEEFNVLMQIIASYDMDFAFLDELRAFLNAEKQQQDEILLRFRGDKQKYRVLKALYGLRDSPKNYYNQVRKRLLKLGFKPLTTGSRCIYYKIEGTHIVDGEEVPNLVLVFHHVDDFLVAAFTLAGLETLLSQLATEFPTTAPERNEGKYLGVGIKRARQERAIMLDMHLKIMDACKTFGIGAEADERAVPMPQTGFVVREEDFEDPKLVKATSARKLTMEECTRYMALVGVLIWISTVRFDIKFPVMYLSWFTKEPRLHHYEMGCKVLGYLFHTSELPLVLGGMPPLVIEAESDCSLGTGTKRRSILGYWAKLNKQGGAVIAKCHTTQMTVTNVFQGELDGHVHAVKCLLALENILVLLGLMNEGTSVAYTDNLPVQQFVTGEADAKLTKHMEIRLWFARDHVRANKYSVNHRKSDELGADMLTKILSSEQFITLRAELMGLWLIPQLTARFLPKEKGAKA